MRKLALMTNFGNVLRKAVGRKLGVKKAVSNAESDISKDAAVGVPGNTNAHWRKLKHIKLNRAFDFLRKRSSTWLPLVWLCVCSCIMVIHFRLFKHGTWYSQRRTKDCCDIFDFCSDRENLIAEALSTLASMMLDPENAGRRPLALLILKFGDDVTAWPHQVHECLQGAVSIAFCVLWRHLYYDFQCFPWLLVPAFDQRRSIGARRATLQGFLDACSCCLDKGVCKALRALDGNIDDYPHLHGVLILRSQTSS